MHGKEGMVWVVVVVVWVGGGGGGVGGGGGGGGGVRVECAGDVWHEEQAELLLITVFVRSCIICDSRRYELSM